jgi:hypothetical protein
MGLSAVSSAGCSRDLRSAAHVPEEVARQIRIEWGFRSVDDGAWTIVVVEACGSKRFVQRLGSVLQGKPNVSTFSPPGRMVLQ